jgi:hypothetical protein
MFSLAHSRLSGWFKLGPHGSFRVRCRVSKREQGEARLFNQNIHSNCFVPNPENFMKPIRKTSVYRGSGAGIERYAGRTFYQPGLRAHARLSLVQKEPGR